MESTVSVSKGVFLFRNGFKRSNKSKKKSHNNFFESLYLKSPWYKTFKTNWSIIEEQLRELHHKTYSVLLSDIVTYIKSFHDDKNSENIKGIIPSASVLTGINQTDHISQFLALYSKIKDEVTPHVAMVNSQDAPTVKHLVENAVWQLYHGSKVLEDTDTEYEEDTAPKLKRKVQCTMKFLQHWYQMKYLNSPSPKKRRKRVKSLVIIIPDFERFNCNILQDFVLILSSYTWCLPVVLVFGVATTVSALHKSFPYHVSSKLLIEVFQSHSSPVYMNQLLENIFLTHKSMFHISGKVLELLTDVFLFYDFSVTGLIQAIKYCMMDHYFGDNIKSICCEPDMLKTSISNLTHEDLDTIRQLPSFRHYIDALQDCHVKSRLSQDKFFREMLHEEMINLHDYTYSFYSCVRLLTVFVKGLPRNEFGKTVREVYTKCTVENITETDTFNQCMKLINFQSQVNLVESVKSALKLVNSILNVESTLKPVGSMSFNNDLNIVTVNSDVGKAFVRTIRVHLQTFLRHIEGANTETTVRVNEDVDGTENIPRNRYDLKEMLKKAAKVETIQSEFEMVRCRFVSYLEEMFSIGLRPPHTRLFHEILFFNDVRNVKKHIVGAPRGALHTALNNPVHYLQCSCCHLPSMESVLHSLPDVCVAYKLHREYGKHINLYDWLQAFASVLLPDEDDENLHHDPNIQARFTSVVADLQFLGFIKSSKRKTDHVMRLTW